MASNSQFYSGENPFIAGRRDKGNNEDSNAIIPLKECVDFLNISFQEYKVFLTP